MKERQTGGERERGEGEYRVAREDREEREEGNRRGRDGEEIERQRERELKNHRERE